MILIINHFGPILGQESCIFGDGSDCYFPCACAPNDNTSRSCDSNTGHCYSGQCLPGYELTDTGRGMSCQPKDSITSYELNAALYLVDPETGERITGDISNIQHRLGLEADWGCLDYITATIAQQYNELKYEFDLKRQYYISTEFYLRSLNYESIVFSRSRFNHFIDIVFCLFDEGEIYRCYENFDFEFAERIYITINQAGQGHKCPPFSTLYLSDVKYRLNIDCLRCQQQTNSPCGNGIWCDTCLPGFRPPDCRRSCDPGYFGVNCAEVVSFDWNGTTKAYKEADHVYIIFHCMTSVPPEIQSMVVMHLQQRYSASPDQFRNIRNVPFTDLPIFYHVEGQESIEKPWYRVIISTEAPEGIVYGSPSDLFTLSASPKTDASTKTNDNQINEFQVAFAIVCLLLFAALLTIWILYKRSKNQSIFPFKSVCSKQETDQDTSQPRESVYENQHFHESNFTDISKDGKDQSQKGSLDNVNKATGADNQAFEEQPYELENVRDKLPKLPPKPTTDDKESPYEGIYRNIKHDDKGNGLYQDLK